MRFATLLVSLVVIAGCQGTPVEGADGRPSGDAAPLQPSVLGVSASVFYAACFDPSEGVCFEILSVETEVEEESESIWSVRTNVEVRFRGRALPISPLQQHFVVGALTAIRSTGQGQAVTVASPNFEGDLYPGRTVRLTGRNGFRKDLFELPITFDVSQFIQLNLTIQTPDGVIWPSYSCKIAEGTCYTGA